MVDIVIHRKDLKKKIEILLNYLLN